MCVDAQHSFFLLLCQLASPNVKSNLSDLENSLSYIRLIDTEGGFLLGGELLQAEGLPMSQLHHAANGVLRVQAQTLLDLEVKLRENAHAANGCGYHWDGFLWIHSHLGGQHFEGGEVALEERDQAQAHLLVFLVLIVLQYVKYDRGEAPGVPAAQVH